ncbi:centrosomal protein 20 [Tribolium castaneum]|uniref:LisH domain-containing protein FOPNL-like Protein n=1 Tax=Tribolium castaneum TaxID=7070 RepID=A0A139WDG9_TRICA|nr:PREDICTED: lisH domain-containing protein FOPNL-like [Tribolium castaneum]KYB25976.1 LisH domain-containing protein FOPNL-like Protein [Tribolium castaneum]|eukprot:XP_001812550.1 PREDICTED: lisH domain-containing protein FOPNL-like [Tribolium castaneum]
MAEPTQTDLLEAVKESLHKDGRLEKFKAELRAAVMSVLNKNSTEEEPPKVPDETRFINELIREYLSWNGYLYTEQILAAECGQNMERLSRDVLTTKLGVMDDSRTAKIPLLYYIVSAFQNHEINEET